MSKQKTVPVTSLKTLGSASPTFNLPVTIKRLGEAAVVINFTAKATRKTEWSALRDAHINPVKAEGQEDSEPVKFSFSAIVGEDMNKGAALVLQCADGWDLEDDFTTDNLKDMEDRFGGALASFLSAYDAAIFHGRLGN